MAQHNSLRESIKNIPVLGSVARSLNRVRIGLMDLFFGQRGKNMFLRGKHTILWNTLRNPQRHKEFVEQRPTVTSAQRGLIQSLTENGVAAGNSADIGLAPDDLTRLQQMVSDFARFSADRIGAATASYADTLDLGSLEHNRDRFRRFFRDKSEAKWDDYILKMNPENSVLDAIHPLVKIGLSAPVLNIVASYFGLWPKLIYADAWYSIPLDPGKRIGSQQWHRDPEDKQMVKVYLYFSDIDETAGAMEYILGTSNTHGGRGFEIGKWKAAGANLYPSADVVEKTFPASQRFYCSGSAGTILFCDTTGLHRGGITKSRPRVLATWTFVTPASHYRHRFTVRPTDGWPPSREAQLAVEP